MPFVELDHGVSLFHDINDIGVTSHGDHDVLTVLLLHGLGSSHCFFEGILPTLAQCHRRLRVIRIDTEGSGLSALRATWAHDNPSSQSIDGITQQALEVLAKLRQSSKDTSTKVVVVGHSMSGITACELGITATHPKTEKTNIPRIEVVGSILIGPVVPSDTIAKAMSQRIDTVRTGIGGMLSMADTIPQKAVGSNATALHRGFIRALLCSQNSLGYMSLCKAITTAKLPAYDQMPKDCPVLIIAGKDDVTASIEGCRYIQQQIGENCKLEVLDGVGHWHCIEAPDRVGSLMVNFLNAIKA